MSNVGRGRRPSPEMVVNKQYLAPAPPQMSLRSMFFSNKVSVHRGELGGSSGADLAVLQMVGCRVAAVSTDPISVPCARGARWRSDIAAGAPTLFKPKKNIFPHFFPMRGKVFLLVGDL